MVAQRDTRLVWALVVVSLFVAPRNAGGEVKLFDPLDAHEWIGETWGSGIAVQYVDFDARRCLKGTVARSAEDWALIRTKRFPLENWCPPIAGVRADVYATDTKSTSRLKLEVRGASFDPVVRSFLSAALVKNKWQTVTWTFPQGGCTDKVGSISIVLERIQGLRPTLYVDNLRLITTAGKEIVWDTMDGARSWFYFGNWKNWAGVEGFPGLEPISSLDGSSASPVASLYLEWDLDHSSQTGETAELGTNGGHSETNPKWLEADFTTVDRIGVWLKSSSTEIAFRVFFWDADAKVGFATASAFPVAAETWQRVIWDIPWPTGFDRADVDEIKLVAADLPKARQGWARLDHLTLHRNEPPGPIDGLVTVLTNYDEQNQLHNQFGGAWGATNSSTDVNQIDLTIDPQGGREGSQAALRLAFHDLDGGFAGCWNSLLGRADYPEFVLDISQWQYLRFYVRGSGTSNERINLKVELKEARQGDEDPFFHTAYRYVAIEASSTAWRPVILNLDLDNPENWSYNRFPPDPRRMKELVFVVEDHFNPDNGWFLLDDIELINTHLPRTPVARGVSDKEFLTYLLNINFNYFRYAVHPDTGLVLDRLAFSDLATVAGTGFGLSAWCLAADIGLMPREQAFTLAQRALQTLATAPMGSTYGQGDPPRSEGQIGVNGFFYHFLDSRTGTRQVTKRADGTFDNGSELSPVDTALCLYGVMSCLQAMTQVQDYTSAQEREIQRLGNTILARVRWPFLLNPKTQPQRVYLAWKPETDPKYPMPHHENTGYVPYDPDHGFYTWDYTTDEILLIALAALAAPNPANQLPPAIINSWQRKQGSFRGNALIQSHPGAAFTYQFANLWLPLKTLPPDLGGTAWWSNAGQALRANFDFCTCPDLLSAFDTFDGISFGLTACEDPTRRYRAFGSPPAGECNDLDDQAAISCFLTDLQDGPNRVNGTLAPYGAASSIDFLPEQTIAALRHYYFDLKLWNTLFGFPDAFHLNVKQLLGVEGELHSTEALSAVHKQLEQHNGAWFHPVQFAIDQGPIVLALGNYLHEGLVQHWTASHPDMAGALERAFPRK